MMEANNSPQPNIVIDLWGGKGFERVCKKFRYG